MYKGRARYGFLVNTYHLETILLQYLRKQDLTIITSKKSLLPLFPFLLPRVTKFPLINAKSRL